MLSGVDAIPLTASPDVAGAGILKSSQPAPPLSPAETVTVIPCAAACSQRELRNALAAALRPASHTPKLRLIASSELLSTTYSAPRNSGPDCKELVGAAGELRSHCSSRVSREGANGMPHRLRREVVQGYDARHDWSQRGRNLRIGHVGLARFSVHIEVMDFRVERVPNLAYVSGKLNHCSASAYSQVVKALARQPICDRLDIGVGGAIEPGKFLGR